MRLEDMDWPEFHERFHDIQVFEGDCEILTKMLVKEIESLLKEFIKTSGDSEDCRRSSLEIERCLDSYSRVIEACCYSLKEKYRKAFEATDPENIAKIEKLEERLREFRENGEIKKG